MEEKLYHDIEAVASLIEEIGEKRFGEYCRVYLELGFPKDNFYSSFREYVEGRKRISLHSFKTFLVDKYDSELAEILNNIIKYNK